MKAGRRPGAAAAWLRRLPLVTHRIEIAGREWRIEAVADQSALSAAADAFEHFPFGLLLWDAAPVLAGVLAEQEAALDGHSVLELGCGVGLVGLVARALGAQVLQTDHGAEALALARENAARNGVTDIEQALADWTDWREARRFDLIVGSDILYEKSLHDALQTILVRNLAPGGRVLLGDPGRSTTPRFIAEMEAGGWHVERRRRRVPALSPIRPGEMVTVTVIEGRRGMLS